MSALGVQFDICSFKFDSFFYKWLSANIPKIPQKIPHKLQKLQLEHKFHQPVIQYLKNLTNFCILSFDIDFGRYSMLI